MERYDSIIIGFGKGGKTLAEYLGNKGEKVAIIEKSQLMYGGTCINVGCIPSKSLVNSAKLSVAELEDSRETYYRKSIEEKTKLTAMLRKKNYDKLNNIENITVYTGTASFLSPYEISIKIKDDTSIIKGSKIFINTGSEPIMPAIEGLIGNRYVYYSKEMMEIEKLPKKLAIVGGGNIGLEFASIYANFGSEVKVFIHSDKFMPREDEDISREIKSVLEEKNIEFKMSVEVKSINEEDKGAVLTYFDSVLNQELEYRADAVLIATGRKPNTDQLNLPAAGIEVTEKGAVKVNEYLETNVPNIWAMGDVVGGLQFTYISLDDYRIVKSQLSQGKEKLSLNSRKNVPYSLFIDPPYSRVGLNERQAIAEGYTIKIAKMMTAAIPKSQVLKETQGILKTIIDAKTNKILGASLFCAESHEMINIIKLAIDEGLPYTTLRDQIFTHPTMSESLNDLFNI